MTNFIKFRDYKIGPKMPCFIIAEAGVNHNGEIELAKQLVDIAVEAGVDAVKFQTFRANKVISTKAPKATYQRETTNEEESQLEMVRGLELTKKEYNELYSYCQEKEILFLSSPFDEESVDLLNELGVPVFKVGSGEITNWPLLTYIAQMNKPIILSTGMSYLSEVEDAIGVIKNAGSDQIILLHCVSNYPADPADANINAMKTMQKAFKLPVGFSDHTLGIEVAIAAVALGACIIEKHFTLDKNLPGPDHKASLNPNEIKDLVMGIRKVERCLGTGIKHPTSSEEENRSIVRRSLTARVDISKGTVLKSDMLQALRPGTGISPVKIGQIVGRETNRAISKGEFISWSDIR